MMVMVEKLTYTNNNAADNDNRADIQTQRREIQRFIHREILNPKIWRVCRVPPQKK
jgi:hypothetical protein